MAHGVVRIDAMAATDVGSKNVSVEYLGANGSTPTGIDNGNVLKVGALKTGKREIFVGGVVAADDSVSDIVLIATPEVMHDDHKYGLDEFTNEEGKICRGLHFVSGDIFSVTGDAITGADIEVNYIVELAAGTKLNVVETATANSTVLGSVIAIETVGKYTYYVIKVD